MAKKKKVVDDQYQGDANVVTRNIGELCTEHMQIFGANTNLMRHIPALSDGLKPGARRILFAMMKLGATPEKKTIKVARIVGEVIGLYHPHGDAPVYETLVKLAQPWNNTEPLIKGQGNFGSIQGDNAAAMRYIEAKISKYAWKCFFEEFNLKYVTSKPNFSGDVLEPEYLPSRYPNSLISGTFGVGYGLAAGQPNFNLQEAISLTLKLLDDPLYPDTTLIPDAPTGAHIIDEGQFPEMARTGEGKFQMRGEVEIDEEHNELIIKSLPIQVTLNQIKDAILKLVEEDKFPGFVDMKEGTNTENPNGVYLRIILKKEIDPHAVQHILYTKTSLQKTISVNFKLIDDYQDQSYNIAKLILNWIDVRRETKRIIFNHQLKEALERQHILETILMVLTGKNGEKTIKVMRTAKSKQESINYLMSTFKISSLQAKMIADMRVSAFTEDSIARMHEEKDMIDKKVKKLSTLVRSFKQIDAIIREELLEGIKLFGQPRRSKIISIDGESKIRDTQHVIVFTSNGMVKKLPAGTTTIGHIDEGDYPKDIIMVKNTVDLMIFDQRGKISKVSVSDLQNAEIDSPGEPLSKYAAIQGNIAAIIPKPTQEELDSIKEPTYLVMLTKNGLIKKTESTNYVNIKNELLGIIVRPDDELISVKILVGDKDMIVYATDGYGVRFPASEIRGTGRMSSGVKAMDLNPDAVVLGMDTIQDADEYLFVMTNKGTGKKCTLDNFAPMVRGTATPLRITTLSPNEELFFVKTISGKEKYKVYLKSGIQDISVTTDVPDLPRMAKGRKIVGVRKGDVIIDIKPQ